MTEKLKTTNLACVSTPQINTWSQSYAENILSRPVHQIQVEIILQNKIKKQQCNRFIYTEKMKCPTI